LTSQIKTELSAELESVGKDRRLRPRLSTSHLMRQVQDLHGSDTPDYLDVSWPSEQDEHYLLADEWIIDALANIYFNAVQELSGRHDGRISTSVRRVNGWIEIRVQDNGRGILPKHKERVFELFQSSRKDSLGFGLWSAKRRVLQNGGQIWLESKPGNGTTFIIRLPAA
jgi:signal transduction histidine kinase